MTDSAQKLRALAKQSRMMSRRAANQERARALRSLADLYERQALELSEPL